MRVTENTYQGPGASMMKPGMTSRELNEIYRSVQGPQSPAMPVTMDDLRRSATPKEQADRIRRLLAEDAAPGRQRQTRAIARTDMAPLPGEPEPFITQKLSNIHKKYVPNPEWGKKHGMIWNGTNWESAPATADLERQAMEMELEARRRKMEREERESGAMPELRAWLSKRLGSGR